MYFFAVPLVLNPHRYLNEKNEQVLSTGNGYQEKMKLFSLASIEYLSIRRITACSRASLVEITLVQKCKSIRPLAC